LRHLTDYLYERERDCEWRIMATNQPAVLFPAILVVTTADRHAFWSDAPARLAKALGRGRLEPFVTTWDAVHAGEGLHPVSRWWRTVRREYPWVFAAGDPSSSIRSMESPSPPTDLAALPLPDDTDGTTNEASLLARKADRGLGFVSAADAVPPPEHRLPRLIHGTLTTSGPQAAAPERAAPSAISAVARAAHDIRSGAEVSTVLRLPSLGVIGEQVLGLSGLDLQLLDCLGCHPFITSAEAALIVDCSPDAARRRCQALCARGLTRSLAARATSPSPDSRAPRRQQTAWSTPAGAAALLPAAPLYELTLQGLSVAAARTGLTLAHAVEQYGLAGGGPGLPEGSRLAQQRRSLLGRLAHTRGTYAVFLSLLRLAQQRRRAGGDDALRVWRNAQAISRGYFRPDGYGQYQQDGRWWGFFVEYDRGTENRRDYLKKLNAYYEYRHSERFHTDYGGFPAVLFVTTSAAAEERIARAARIAVRQPNRDGSYRRETAPLLLYLTTEARYGGDGATSAPPDGLLAPIWRDMHTDARGHWRTGEYGSSDPGSESAVA
jgi:hypothetical protein